MHSRAQSPNSLLVNHWSAANVALTLLLALLFLLFLLLLLTVLALPAQAQSSAPATARQAVTLPQYAARLAPTTNASRADLKQPQASYKNPANSRVRKTWPLDNNGVLYENGPINGTTDAWTINSGFVVSDTIMIPSRGGPISALSFGAWLFPGDVLQSIEVSISSQALGGGTVYSDQVVNFTQSACSGNQYGFNVCMETSDSSFGSANLAAGTYWVSLDNAVVNNGDPIYWDENSGVGCNSPGCPSQASENSVGTIPSEAFTILGGTTSTCYFNCPPECVQDEGDFQSHS